MEENPSINSKRSAVNGETKHGSLNSTIFY